MDEVTKKPDAVSNILQGVIIPAEWDADGKATAVMLSDFEEREYWINRSNPFTKELIKLVKKTIKVHGCSIEREGDKSMLSFKGYSLL